MHPGSFVLPGWFAFCLALVLAGSAIATAGPRQIWSNCNLVPHRNNDDHSFRVRHGTHIGVLRLYAVDGPETNPALKERIEEQWKYWKLPDGAAVIELGKC